MMVEINWVSPPRKRNRLAFSHMWFTEIAWIRNMGENWKFFKQKFQIYLIASKASTEDGDYKIALLLNLRPVLCTRVPRSASQDFVARRSLILLS